MPLDCYYSAKNAILAQKLSIISQKQKIQQKSKQQNEQHKLKIPFSTLKRQIRDLHPSSIKDIVKKVQNTPWNSIGGISKAKQAIRQSVEWPLKYPKSFERMGIQPPQGVLLYGPPGCAKTMCARALASQSGLNFLSVKGPQLFSKYVGETEKAVRQLFRRARLSSPCIIFLDQVDAMAGQRSNDSDQSKSDSGGGRVGERALTQLLTQMDGVTAQEKVIIVAATNRPWAIDLALIRAGRLDRLVYIGLPDLNDRVQILEVSSKKTPKSQDVDLFQIGKISQGRTGAQLSLICRQAAMFAIEENIQKCSEVKQEHFIKAVNKVKARVNQDVLKQFRNFQDKIN